MNRRTVAAVELLVGAGAIYGGLELLTDAEGFGIREVWLGDTPFGDYTVPGLTLLVLIGGGMLTAAGLALAGRRSAALGAAVMGVLLLLFLAVETWAIGLQGGMQYVLLAGCGAAGAFLLVAGIRMHRPAAP